MSKERILTYYERLTKMTENMQKSMQEKVSTGAEFKKITGTEFEDIVYKALQEAGFSENDITHSPQKFPDFVLNDNINGKKVGIEVKKTDSSKWEVIGGSIYESLKNDIEETYVLMAKFGKNNPEVRLKKYEECIAALKVTHSPRFYLNLDLEEGEDYLSKNNAKELLDLSGEDLNKKIRELLRSNKSTWWSEAETTPFSELSKEEKNIYLNDGVALFPEVFGGDYSNFTPWMIYSCLVWCGNVRDIFSAGGNKKLEDCNIFVSAVMARAFENTDKIKDRINNMSDDEISKFWKVDPSCITSRIEEWLGQVKSYIRLSNDLIKNNQGLDEHNKVSNDDMAEIVVERYLTKLREKLL